MTTEPSHAPRDTFVPVSETLRERGARSWLGDEWPRADLLWLLAITGVAALLRLQQLEQWSLSADEALTWKAATESLREGHAFFTRESGFHPLCYHALRLLLDAGVLPSGGEGWLRLPFVFLGILTVPLLGLVGDLFVGRRAALLAAGLLAIHPWHVHASQSATAPGTALFFALLAAGTAWVGLRMHHVPSRVLAAAFVALAGLAHPTGWCLGLALVAWLLGSLAPAMARGLRIVCGAAVFGLAVAAVWWAFDRLGAPLVPSTAAAWSTLDFAVRVVADAGVLLGLLAVVGMLGGREAGARGAAAPVQQQARGFLLAAALVPLGMPLLLAGLGAPAAADHALPALPWLLLLGSVAALRSTALVRSALGSTRGSALGTRARLASGVIPLALGLGMLVDTYLYATVRAGLRPDWRAARNLVLHAAGRQPGFTVLAGEGWESLCYYLRPNHWRDPLGDPHPNKQLARLGALPSAFPADVARAGDGGGALFVVLLRAEVESLAGDAAASERLEKEFRLTDVLPCALGVRDETIYVYRRIDRS